MKMNKAYATVLAADSLDAIFKQRFGGAVNIRGIRYQILYSLYKTLHSMCADASAEVRLEGIEDLDIIGLSVDNQYIQVKTAEQTWNFAKLKDPLKNFLEVMRKEPTAQFKLIVNFPLPLNEEIGKLANFGSLGEQDKQKIKTKFNQYCREIGANTSEASVLLTTLTIETVSLGRLWQDLRQQIASMFGIGSEVIDTYVGVLTDQFTQWAEARKTIAKSDLNKVRDAIGRSLARESEYQAYGKTLIDRLTWIKDERPDDYRAGKQTRPGHIASGLDFKRERWLKQIADVIDKTKICVIKSSSGQGKSSLAFRFAFENWKDNSIFLLNKMATEQDAEQVCSFLKFQRSLAIVPFLIIDNANWQKRYWGRVAQECVSCGGQAIVTVRAEDWARFSEPSLITYDVIEPMLGLDEAKEICTVFRKSRRLHASIRSADHAYELLLQPKLLLEYVYLLTHGQMLSERLSEQIRRFSTPEDEPAKAAMLRRVALAAIAGVPLSLDALFTGLTLHQDPQQILATLTGEYLSINGGQVSGLHWVRSQHLVKLLHTSYPNVASTALTMLGLISQEYLAVFIAGMCEVPEFDWQAFLANVVTEYRSALPAVLVGIIDGLFHVGERLFFERNREYFDQYIQKYGLASSVFITSYFTPLVDVRESIRRGLEIARSGAYEDLISIASMMKQDIRGLRLCQHFLANIETPTKERLTADYRYTGLLYDWCRISQIDISGWPAIAADVMIHSKIIFELPLESFCAFLQGMYTHDEQLYHHWFKEHKNTILSYLRFHTDTISLQLVNNEAYIQYIPSYEFREKPHSQTMNRLNHIRSALPFIEIYHAQAQWVLPLGLKPTTDESTKAIPRRNLQHVSDGPKNAALSHICERAYRPDSYYVYQEKWYSFRDNAVRVTEAFVNIVTELLMVKYSQEHLDLRTMNDSYQTLRMQSIQLPSLPCQAAESLEKQLHCAQEWESSLTNSLWQFIESMLPDTGDRERIKHLSQYNATMMLVRLSVFHEHLAGLYRVSADYFDGRSLNARERRVYSDWTSLLKIYFSWDSTPVSNVRTYSLAKEEARRQSMLVRLHSALASLEQHGLRFVYPKDSRIQIDSLSHLPLGIEVSDPTTSSEQLALTMAALSQEQELVDFFYLIPLWQGARFLDGGFRISGNTLRKLSMGENVPWESLAPSPIPNEILSLLGDIPLRTSDIIESSNTIGTLRSELEMIQNHLTAIEPLAGAEADFDRRLYARHKKELQARLHQFIDIRDNIGIKYSAFIPLHAAIWNEIENRILSLTSAFSL